MGTRPERSSCAEVGAVPVEATAARQFSQEAPAAAPVEIQARDSQTSPRALHLQEQGCDEQAGQEAPLDGGLPWGWEAALEAAPESAPFAAVQASRGAAHRGTSAEREAGGEHRVVETAPGDPHREGQAGGLRTGESTVTITQKRLDVQTTSAAAQAQGRSQTARQGAVLEGKACDGQAAAGAAPVERQVGVLTNGWETVHCPSVAEELSDGAQMVQVAAAGSVQTAQSVMLVGGQVGVGVGHTVQAAGQSGQVAAIEEGHVSGVKEAQSAMVVQGQVPDGQTSQSPAVLEFCAGSGYGASKPLAGNGQFTDSRMAQSVAAMHGQVGSAPMVPLLEETTAHKVGDPLGVAAAAISAKPAQGAAKGRISKKPVTNRASKRDLICDWPGCGKPCSCRSVMVIHQRTHTGEQPFACTVPSCGMRFNKAGNMARHMRTHTGERPHVCNVPKCGKDFARAEDLSRHNLTHTGERPYPCLFPGCGKRFSQTGSLATHGKTHTARPHQCKVHGCGKRFAEENHLAIHRETTHCAESDHASQLK